MTASKEKCAVTTLAAMLSHTDRERLLERLAELRELDREMRRPGSLASPDEPIALHRATRQQGQDDTKKSAP